MKVNKFNAKKVIAENGEIFDSKKEYNYYCNLLIQKNVTEKKYRVKNIVRQKKYNIIINDLLCGYYKLDFEIEYEDGSFRHIDIKGFKKGSAYQYFRLKKKIIEAIYNIKIEEI